MLAIASAVCLLVVVLILVAAVRRNSNAMTADLRPGPVPAHPLWVTGTTWIVGGGVQISFFRLNTAEQGQRVGDGDLTVFAGVLF